MTRNRLALARYAVLGILGVACFLLILVVLTAVLLVLSPFLLSINAWIFLDEQFFRFRLWRAGRLMRWNAAVNHLRSGGTLLIEIPPSGGVADRLWLFRDRIDKLDPAAPWGAFNLLEQQLRAQSPTLTAGDDFTQWSHTNLRQLARSAVLVTPIPGRTIWHYVNELPAADRRVAFVLSPDLTTAVRRSFRRKRG